MEIQQQTAENQKTAAELLKEDRQVERANTAKGIGSAIPYLGLLVMGTGDLSNEQQIKARALIDRDERLALLAKEKNCEKGE